MAEHDTILALANSMLNDAKIPVSVSYRPCRTKTGSFKFNYEVLHEGHSLASYRTSKGLIDFISKTTSSKRGIRL